MTVSNIWRCDCLDPIVFLGRSKTCRGSYSPSSLVGEDCLNCERLQFRRNVGEPKNATTPLFHTGAPSVLSPHYLSICSFPFPPDPHLPSGNPGLTDSIPWAQSNSKFSLPRMYRSEVSLRDDMGTKKN